MFYSVVEHARISSHRYTLSLCNGDNGVESDVIQCVPGNTNMISMIRNDISSPRSVILTINLKTINLTLYSATPTHTISTTPTPSPSPPTLQDVEDIVSAFLLVSMNNVQYCSSQIIFNWMQLIMFRSVCLSVCLSVHRLMCLLWLLWTYCLSYLQTLLTTLSDCQYWEEHSQLHRTCQSLLNLLR